MPNWQPDWSDVHFDHAAAHQYAAACRHAAQVIDRVVQERTRLAQQAVIDWEGPTRERFDRELSRWVSEAAQVAMRLEVVARQVDTAAEVARRAQAEREQARARWWAERAAEEQQAAEAAANAAAAATAATGDGSGSATGALADARG